MVSEGHTNPTPGMDCGAESAMTAPPTSSLAYHDAERREVLPFIKRDSRILEIGCGTGATLALLKSHGLCRWAGGVEYAPEAAKRAALVADRLWQGDVESLDLDIPAGALDAVLCLDVLEHLVDPWKLTERLAQLLAPGGILLASLPNIRNDRILRDLAFRGRWDYQDDGILDRTHLRFFTRTTATALVAGAGLKVQSVTPLMRLKKWRLKWILNHLSGNRLTDFYATQFLICGHK